ncbi:MAG: triose-phosphate isomerase [Caulobacterales bacterium]|nr:triose-phosphate isomerase [Caulobacterales bacterium]
MKNGKFIVGNWKMNGSLASKSLISEIDESCVDMLSEDLQIGICPPFPLIANAKEWVFKSPIKIGAQDCHFKNSGAHTGDISPQLLKEIGAEIVILGHSERRANHFETNEIVKSKAINAIANGLLPIICVGETDEERKANKQKEIVLGQIENSCPHDCSQIVIAYEPVWAIGTGNVASIDDILKMHADIRAKLVSLYNEAGNKIKILYGGSVNAQNAGQILNIDNVDGALVGGASLKAPDFLSIIDGAKAK